MSSRQIGTSQKESRADHFKLIFFFDLKDIQTAQFDSVFSYELSTLKLISKDFQTIQFDSGFFFSTLTEHVETRFKRLLNCSVQ